MRRYASRVPHNLVLVFFILLAISSYYGPFLGEDVCYLNEDRDPKVFFNELGLFLAFLLVFDRLLEQVWQCDPL